MPTPEQYRKARLLLGWEPIDVALAAATTAAVVLRLENGLGVRSQVRANVSLALAARGITFSRDGQVSLASPIATDRRLPELQLSGEQVRQARGLLGWSQDQLAHAAGVGRSTLGAFEVGITSRPRTVAALMIALVTAGVAVDAEGRITLHKGGPPA